VNTVALTLEQCWHDVPGGTAVAAVGMAAALARRADLHVVGVAARHASPPPPDWIPPVAVRHLPFPRLFLYEAWHRFRWPAVQRATGKVDLIHATSIAIPPRSAPLVVTIHDLLFLKEPKHFTARGLSFFKRGLKLAMQDADLVLCSSRATRDHCLEVGFNEERLRLVPLGIDEQPATATDVARVRERFGLTRRYVMWTGTIEPRKNLRGLLSAWRTLDRDDVDLVLVGPKGWREDLDELARNKSSTIKILGFVPRAHLNALYAGAEVFCFPSFREGFGFPVLEAMVQGTPVVTSAGTSTEEIAAGAAELIDPHDASSIADAVARILDDSQLATRLKDAGIQRAASYSWDATGQRVAAAYEELV